MNTNAPFMICFLLESEVYWFVPLSPYEVTVSDIKSVLFQLTLLPPDASFENFSHSLSIVARTYEEIEIFHVHVTFRLCISIFLIKYMIEPYSNHFILNRDSKEYYSCCPGQSVLFCGTDPCSLFLGS